jgi:phosphate transport system permease protein
VSKSYRRRRAVDWLARAACMAAAALALVPLAAVLLYVARRGLQAVDWSFFTQLPKPTGERGGGMQNAIVGTLALVGLASALGVPVGIGAGIYLAELGTGKLARAVRFAADVLSGVPSIAVGVFTYSLIVIAMRGFSALAGGFALGIIMIPTVTRTTEELLKLVPDALREAALALGVPRWRATLRVVVVTALPGIATGIMLAVARVAGETAPLLFTAFNNRLFSVALTRPIGSLPVQIFTYATSPFDDWNRQAAAAALVLVTMVLVLNLLSRLVLSRRTAR